MAGPRVSVRVRRADWGNIPARMTAQLVQEIARAGLRRTRKRVDHAALRTMKVRGVNQYRADVVGSRGGPGIIRPVRAKALSFDWRGRRWNLQSVNGVGFGPLIEAETGRVTSDELDYSKIQID